MPIETLAVAPHRPIKADSAQNHWSIKASKVHSYLFFPSTKKSWLTIFNTVLMANKYEYVEVSQPYVEPGLKILVYLKPKRYERAWLFMKPFTTLIWISTRAKHLTWFCCMVNRARQDQESGGTTWNQIGASFGL